jgi:hypothetical protein
MAYSYSLVMLCPSEHRTGVEAAGLALGHSGQEYGVPLSPTGAEPATHYGLRAAAAADYVLAVTGTLPDRDPTPDEETRVAEILAPLAPEQVAGLRAVLVMSARPDADRHGHFDAVIADAGLVRVESEDAP